MILSAGVLLLSACREASGADSDRPGTDTPAVSAPAAAPSVSSTPAERPAIIPPPLLQVDYDQAVRIIPASFNPLTQFASIVAAYRGLAELPQPVGWFGGTLTGGHSFQIGLSLPTDAPGRVELRFPVRVSISLTEAAADRLNVISPSSSGGGGGFNSFPGFVLQVGHLELMPELILVDRLEPGALTEVGYDFVAACVDAGVYHLDFALPYEVHSGDLVQSWMAPFGVDLACPQQADAWIFDPESGALAGTSSSRLNGGVYQLVD
jgi:hypothetical protein